ncbi:MAG: hypothetical protein HYU73_22245 [Betaproteobacteria bacterium]|nr:hypothetical protein [Betaproteobacteria bacterium]
MCANACNGRRRSPRAKRRRQGIAPLRNTPPAESDEFRARALSLLCIAGLARLPQVSLPLAKLDGCPLGLSLIAAHGADTMLLDIARRLDPGN